MKHNQFRTKITRFVEQLAESNNGFSIFLDITNSARMIYVYGNKSVCLYSLYLSFSDKGMIVYAQEGASFPASYLHHTCSSNCNYTYFNCAISLIEEIHQKMAGKNV